MTNRDVLTGFYVVAIGGLSGGVLFPIGSEAVSYAAQVVADTAPVARIEYVITNQHRNSTSQVDSMWLKEEAGIEETGRDSGKIDRNLHFSVFHSGNNYSVAHLTRKTPAPHVRSDRFKRKRTREA